MKLPTFKNARLVYDAYKSAGRIRTTGHPPRGSLVFWDAYSGSTNFGHVAVSLGYDPALGKSRAVGTVGWDNQFKANTDYPIASGYLGWVSP